MLLHQVQRDERHRSGQIRGRGTSILLVRLLLHATMNVWLLWGSCGIALLLHCGI